MSAWCFRYSLYAQSTSLIWFNTNFSLFFLKFVYKITHDDQEWKKIHHINYSERTCHLVLLISKIAVLDLPGCGSLLGVCERCATGFLIHTTDQGFWSLRMGFLTEMEVWLMNIECFSTGNTSIMSSKVN